MRKSGASAGIETGSTTLSAVVADELVDEEVPTFDHRAARGVLARVAPEHEHLVDLLTELVGRLHGLVGPGLVVDELAAAVVPVHGHEDAAAGVGEPVPARGAREPAEHLAVDGAEPCAGEHGDRELRDHRQIEGDPVAGLHPAGVSEQTCELVHAPVELLVGDGLGVLIFGLGHPDDRRLVARLRQVAVDAVVAGVETAADEPLPEGRIARVEHRLPPRVPRQEVGVLLEAIGEPLFAEPLEDLRIRGIRLRDEGRGGVVVALFAPVDGNLGLRDLLGLGLLRRKLFCHRSSPISGISAVGPLSRAPPGRAGATGPSWRTVP